jgi:enoyl-[acyl-carrier protein] reductase II
VYRQCVLSLVTHSADAVSVFQGAKAFISGRGFPRKDVIEKFHAKGMVVGMIAGKVKHAVEAVAGGVDFVVVQGHEGGGHTGEIALTVLLPQIVDAVGGKVPVVAAGGIYDGRGLAASLSYGASGVWVGTRFMLTPESNTHPKYKEHLLKASSDDTTVTRAFTGKPMRVLKNKYQKYYDEHPDKITSIQVAQSTKDGVWKLHGGDDNLTEEDWEKQAFVTGQCIGAITVSTCNYSMRFTGGLFF